MRRPLASHTVPPTHFCNRPRRGRLSDVQHHPVPIRRENPACHAHRHLCAYAHKCI